MLLFLTTVPGLAAAETRVGATVTVPEDAVVNGDLTTVAGTVRILGTVEGDVTAVGGDVVVAGEVNGDVVAGGGQIAVTGAVGGDLRAFGGVVRVDGTVAEDLNAVVGRADVGGRIGGNTDIVGGLVDVRAGAELQGRLRTSSIRTQVNGSVGGTEPQVVENASVAVRGDEPVVDGWSGRSSPTGPVQLRDRPAKVALAVAPAPVVGQLVPGRGGLFELTVFETYRFLVNLLLGVVLLVLFPRSSDDVASLVATRPVQVGAYGLAVALFGPAVLLVLALSLFGLPLAVAGGALLIIAAWVGSVYGRYAVGRWALTVLTRGFEALDVGPPRLDNRWLALIVGYALVGVLIRIPIVGVAFDTVVLALGLGTLASLGYDAYRRSERRPAAMDRASELERRPEETSATETGGESERS